MDLYHIRQGSISRMLHSTSSSERSLGPLYSHQHSLAALARVTVHFSEGASPRPYRFTLAPIDGTPICWTVLYTGLGNCDRSSCHRLR